MFEQMLLQTVYFSKGKKQQYSAAANWCDLYYLSPWTVTDRAFFHVVQLGDCVMQLIAVCFDSE